jgi:hypothetical protein
LAHKILFVSATCQLVFSSPLPIWLLFSKSKTLSTLLIVNQNVAFSNDIFIKYHKIFIMLFFAPKLSFLIHKKTQAVILACATM